MLIEVWSDLVCPWCYIGKRNLEQALKQFDTTEEVTVRWRSFELDPNAPKAAADDLTDIIARKYRVSREQAAAQMTHVAEVAEGVGLHYRFDLAKRSNTFDGHRLIHWAGDPAVGGSPVRATAMKERLLRAYFTEGVDLGDVAALAALAGEAGCDAVEAAAVLASDRYADAVRADELAAREEGVTGVPYFRVNGGIGISGAHPPELLLRMFERAPASE
jgi:predicted DsbA family dithiol-disulfide isomerase